MPWTLPKNHNLKITKLVDYETEPGAYPTWSATVAYVAGDSVLFNNILYKAVGGSTGITPGSVEGVWEVAPLDPTKLTPFETIKKMIESDSPDEEEIIRIILDKEYPLTELGTEKLYDLACEKQLDTVIKLMEQNIKWIGTLNPSRFGYKAGSTEPIRRRCTLTTAGGRKRKSRTHIKKGTRKHKSRAKTKRFTRK